MGGHDDGEYVQQNDRRGFVPGGALCQIAHVVSAGFGNDILWREVGRFAPGYLYWKRGAGMQSR
jgi:hypothetical protein